MADVEQKPRYELHHDRLEETYTIRKVQDIGPFESREAAREWMLARPSDTPVARITELEAALADASEELNNAGCQVAASRAHRAVARRHHRGQ